MAHSIPMIRASVIAPMRRWLSEIGRDPTPFLARADLAWVPEDAPLLPIPLRSAIDLLVGIARSEGPDIPYRIVGVRGVFEIDLIGRMALRGPTVRDGLMRIARLMPLHCTHEILQVTSDGGVLKVRDGWMMSIGGDEVLHLVQQYETALIDRICGVACDDPPCLSRVAMVPHPETGLEHLRQRLGSRVCASGDRALDITIEESVADLPFPEEIRASAAQEPVPDWPPLRQGKTLSGDVATLVAGMLPFATPSLDRVAAAADTSGRTLKRRLRAEGSSFSGIVEQTRARIGLKRLQEGAPVMLKDLARDLGYSDQATLTRAVRRWTGNAPSEILSRPGSDT